MLAENTNFIKINRGSTGIRFALYGKDEMNLKYQKQAVK
ncbi:hypothetical protein LCGC14_1457370 [marine sediment metagenome]|uniref:Uncharacterized protein n=1 Tax=marine sediment metagenome TaxID=412755 RepID=A0A0F9K2A9_9ZZZZ